MQKGREQLEISGTQSLTLLAGGSELSFIASKVPGHFWGAFFRSRKTFDPESQVGDAVRLASNKNTELRLVGLRFQSQADSLPV